MQQQDNGEHCLQCDSQGRVIGLDPETYAVTFTCPQCADSEWSFDHKLNRRKISGRTLVRLQHIIDNLPSGPFLRYCIATPDPPLKEEEIIVLQQRVERLQQKWQLQIIQGRTTDDKYNTVEMHVFVNAATGTSLACPDAAQ